ncbi:beta-galactosidase-like [Cajanus cajan]|uniref:beta-galactosidase-like n=1 Tax=Cajanus cajan TaxID=3821 RepID=UPI00098DB9A9|nr:beta-galactosidase-like [Cajanus cajan]
MVGESRRTVCVAGCTRLTLRRCSFRDELLAPPPAKPPAIVLTNWFGGLGPASRSSRSRTASPGPRGESEGRSGYRHWYHGGTNFGRTSGGPYITTSYDYDAPLEYIGNLNQPKRGHLKRLHELLRSMEQVLTMGSSRNVEYGNLMTATIYSYAGKEVCFLGNANSSMDANINFQNTQYTVPAWSVNAQTSIMVKNNDDSNTLNWDWRPEALYTQTKIGQPLGSVAMSSPQLLDQKLITNGTTDYLWYITRYNNFSVTPFCRIKLRVKTKGHILHVFVNGAHIGSQYARYGQYSFTFEGSIKMNHGKNEISLVSGTVGLANYGPHFDNVKVGISGPIQLVSQKEGTEMIKDISKNGWKYKVGMHGENVKLYSPGSINHIKWFTNGLPTDRIFLWYKATIYSYAGKEVCFLGNANSSMDANINFQNTQYTVPAWFFWKAEIHSHSYGSGARAVEIWGEIVKRLEAIAVDLELELWKSEIQFEAPES